MGIEEQWSDVVEQAAGDGSDVEVIVCPECGGRAAWRGVTGTCWEAACFWSETGARCAGRFVQAKIIAFPTGCSPQPTTAEHGNVITRLVVKVRKLTPDEAAVAGQLLWLLQQPDRAMFIRLLLGAEYSAALNR